MPAPPEAGTTGAARVGVVAGSPRSAEGEAGSAEAMPKRRQNLDAGFPDWTWFHPRGLTKEPSSSRTVTDRSERLRFSHGVGTIARVDAISRGGGSVRRQGGHHRRWTASPHSREVR